MFEKITNFNELAEEFQSILYVFHEKAAYKYLNEKEALKELRDDAERINKEKGNWGDTTPALFMFANLSGLKQ